MIHITLQEETAGGLGNYEGKKTLKPEGWLLGSARDTHSPPPHLGGKLSIYSWLVQVLPSPELHNIKYKHKFLIYIKSEVKDIGSVGCFEFYLL